MKMLQYDSSAEKWIDLDGSNQIFLRVIYGDQRPITDINFYRIKYQKGQPDKMVRLLKLIIYSCLANSSEHGH